MTTDKKHSLIASDRIEGTAVRRSNGDKIGRIERLMLDKVSGNVAYAILSFGGFLGIGDQHLPVPWTKLTYNHDLEAYQLDRRNDSMTITGYRRIGVRMDSVQPLSCVYIAA